MTDTLTNRIEKLEAQVAALQALMISNMAATRRAQRFVTDTTIELAESFCDDAVNAGLRPMADEVQAMLDALARFHERGKDPEP